MPYSEHLSEGGSRRTTTCHRPANPRLEALGSIAEGRRANLVLANGDILQASTQVVALFIDGRPLEPTSKHARLYERYRERLKEVKEGRAPLGTK